MHRNPDNYDRRSWLIIIVMKTSVESSSFSKSSATYPCNSLVPLESTAHQNLIIIIIKSPSGCIIVEPLERIAFCNNNHSYFSRKKILSLQIWPFHRKLLALFVVSVFLRYIRWRYELGNTFQTSFTPQIDEQTFFSAFHPNNRVWLTLFPQYSD